MLFHTGQDGVKSPHLILKKYFSLKENQAQQRLWFYLPTSEQKWSPKSLVEAWGCITILFWTSAWTVRILLWHFKKVELNLPTQPGKVSQLPLPVQHTCTQVYSYYFSPIPQGIFHPQSRLVQYGSKHCKTFTQKHPPTKKKLQARYRIHSILVGNDRKQLFNSHRNHTQEAETEKSKLFSRTL